MRVGIIGTFRVPEENDNGRRVVDLCGVGNTYFEHKSLYKYTRVARDNTEWRQKARKIWCW